jgi:hypothetical protein
MRDETESSIERADDVSTGKGADHSELVNAHLPIALRDKFEIFSYRNAASILASSFPSQFSQIIDALSNFSISRTMIRTPGGSKGPIAKYVDTLFAEPDGWRETRISADLQVKLLDAKKTDHVFQEYVRTGFLDGHRIDFLNGRVALDLEWNSKDQTYDRDLYAFSAFYDAGAIDVGVLLTRGSSLDNNFFRSLGNVLNKDGSEGAGPVYKKYGASTTWMGKLLYRLDAGRNGGCPVLAIGITPNCVTDD